MNAPPSAAKVVCIDFDGTIAKWGGLHVFPAPLPGAAQALRELHDAGYTIVIFTSRLSPAWLAADYASFGFSSPDEFGASNQRYVEDYLDRHDIPFDDITAEKRAAEAYFDDRAVRVSQHSPLITQVRRFLAGGFGE